MKKEGLIGVFLKTYSTIYPLTGLGGGEFKEVITQYSEFLNPQGWDYSDFERYISKDIVIEKSLLYDLQDLKIIYGHLVKEAHKQMDFLEHQQIDFFQKYLSNLPHTLTTRVLEIELEGKRLEINWWFSAQNGVGRFMFLKGLLKHMLEEIKSEGKIGVLFYSKEAPNWKRSILRIE